MRSMNSGGLVPPVYAHLVSQKHRSAPSNAPEQEKNTTQTPQKDMQLCEFGGKLHWCSEFCSCL